MTKYTASGIPLSAWLRLFDLQNLHEAFRPGSDLHIPEDEYNRMRLKIISEERRRTRRLGGRRRMIVAAARRRVWQATRGRLN
jgi:hypothetical protein